jgi:hypothetical protein
MRNLAVIANMIAAKRANYSGEKWKRFTVVKDTKNVTDSGSRARARDISCVIDDELALIKSFAGRGWIYDPEFSIASLKKAGAVQVRSDGSGFVSTVAYILSGEGDKMETTAEVDISVAAVSA